MPLEQQLRDALRTMINRHGMKIADEPRRCEGILRDQFPANSLEINLLVMAAKERIPHDLAAWEETQSADMAIAKLGRRLSARCGFDEQLARWSVESWALAMGLHIQHVSTNGINPDSLPENQLRGAIRLAMADRKVTAVEEAHLRHVAETLHIPAQRFEQIMDQVRRDPQHLPPTGSRTAIWIGLGCLLLTVAIAAGVVIYRQRTITSSAGASPPPATALSPVDNTAETTVRAESKPAPPVIAEPPPAPAGLSVRVLDQLTRRTDLSALIAQRLATLDARRATYRAKQRDLTVFLRRLQTAQRRAKDENRWPAKVAGRSFDEATLANVVAATEASVADVTSCLDEDEALRAESAQAKLIIDREIAEIGALVRKLQTAPTPAATAEALARVDAWEVELRQWQTLTARPTREPTHPLDIEAILK